MSDSFVKYRPRSVSKFMVGVFVVLLLPPLTIGLISAAVELVRGGDVMRFGSFILKVLPFAGGLCAVVFRPADRIVIDRAAGLVRHLPSWSLRAGAEHPLDGLASVVVEANPKGALHRLVLMYRDGSKLPLTEQFYYDEASHALVARTLTARIRDHHLG